MSAVASQREYSFTDRDFERVRELVAEHTGINLTEAKKDLVYGRLSKRLRAHGLKSFSDYTDMVAAGSADEMEHFTNAITTNLTSFFREAHHFDYLENTILPELRKRNAARRRIRIWSAGCSTGEEPYSISMSVHDAFPELSSWDLKILATDLDSNCVQTAANGVYAADRIEGLSKARKKRWFQDGKDELQGQVMVDEKLKSIITFKQLNLMKQWPMRGPFDVIFCRNVVIYFDKSTQRVLFDRYAKLVPPGGHLILGHSESLHNVTDKFELFEKTIYRRVA